MSSSALSVSRSAAPASDRNFYLAFGIVCAVIVVAGFGPTYFFSSAVEQQVKPLTPLLHIHGAAFTAWIGLFIAQVALVRADRSDLHMKLGVLGVAVAVVMLVSAVLVGIDGVAAGRGPGGPNLSPAARLLVPFKTAVIVAAFIAAGVFLRRKRETHKRLMVLAMIAMLSPALSRLVQLGKLQTLLGMTTPAIVMTVMGVLISAAMINDYLKRRQVNMTYVAGAAVLFILGPVSPLNAPVSQSQSWQSIVKWLIT